MAPPWHPSPAASLQIRFRSQIFRKVYSLFFQSLSTPGWSSPMPLVVPWNRRVTDRKAELGTVSNRSTRQFGAVWERDWGSSGTKPELGLARRPHGVARCGQRYPTIPLCNILPRPKPVTDSSPHKINNLRRKQPSTPNPCATLRIERGSLTTHECDE